MAIPILNHMDFQKAAEIQNVLLHTTGSGDVSSPGTGQIIYDSGAVKVYNGSAWLTLASGGGTRVVAVDTNGDGSVNNTLELSENLVLKKGSGVSLSEAGGVVTIAATGTQLTAEQVEDMVGGMLDGTETGISVSYDDTNGNLDFVIGAGNIVHSMLGADAVDGDNIGDDVINSEHIAAGAVDTEHIADDNVTYAKIQNVAANNVLLGNDDGAGSGIQELTKANVLTLLNVEDGATADQSNAEIRAAVEAATDSNVFTDADHTKLNGIEASATADQSNAEIRAAVEAATDSNVFTDADHTKLNGIEASADVTDTANVKAALGAAMPSNTLAIGDASTVTTIAGNLIVSGTQTIQNETVQVVENNTILFEGATADDHETKLTVTDPTADRTITLPNATGTVALTSDLVANEKVTKLLSGDGSTTAHVISHGLGTNIVSTKVLHYGNAGTGATYEEVIVETKAGVDANKVVLTFASAPSATADYLVLVSKFPAAS